MGKRTKQKTEFGDFQTPDGLALKVVRLLQQRGLQPASIVEPTCGIGNFIFAALKVFPNAHTLLGVEINPCYITRAAERIHALGPRAPVEMRQADFFSFDWPKVMQQLPAPVLVVGNPPWVTASRLASLESTNVPTKSNFQGLRGLDAVTGKSNFDIAEWMVLRLLDSLQTRVGAIAMLVKTSVARRILLHAWKSGKAISNAMMYRFDAQVYFEAAADACLLVIEVGGAHATTACEVRDLEYPHAPGHHIAFRRGALIADAEKLQRAFHLWLAEPGQSPVRWRSGVKHDCAAVMELEDKGVGLFNGLGERVDIEDDRIFPLLKGSDVASQSPRSCRFMVLPQLRTGDSTDSLKRLLPETWVYLSRHADRLDARASSIYRNRARFSVFGVGPYTFAPWKVAICGLYKVLRFAVVGPRQGKPVVFDDTVYHLSFPEEEQARSVASLLESEVARSFFEAFIFWDSKRPITVDLLQRLDVLALASELGRERDTRWLAPHGKLYVPSDASLF